MYAQCSCYLSLHETLALGRNHGREGFLGDSEEIVYLFTVDGNLTARSDRLIRRCV